MTKREIELDENLKHEMDVSSGALSWLRRHPPMDENFKQEIVRMLSEFNALIYKNSDKLDYSNAPRSNIRQLKTQHE
jgi:hypothetical protein